MGRLGWAARRQALRVRSAGERGASAVEYGIMVALIAAVVLLAVLFLGQETSNTFSCTAASIRTSEPQC